MHIVRMIKFFREKDFTMSSKAKRSAALVLAAMMCATAFAGCSSGSTGGNSSNPNGSTQPNGSNGGTSTPAVERPSDDKIKELIKNEAKDGKIELKVWTPGGDKKFVKTVTEKFVEKYKVDGVTYTIKVVEKGEDKCIGALTEDPTKGADVFQFPTDQLLTGVQSGALAEVPAIYQGSMIEDNMAEASESCKNGDKYYAYPMTSDNGYFMFYDKSVFTDDDITSFEKMLAKAESQGYNILMPFDNAWYNASFFYAAGCDIQLDTATSKMKLVDFASDKGVNAVKAMIDLSKSKSMIIAGDDAAIATELSTGKLKAVVTGTWNTANIKKTFGDANFGAAKLPTAKIGGADTQLHSFGGFKLVGVKKSTAYPVTSATLASYMTSEEVQIERYKERNMIPTNNKARESDEIKNDPTAMAIEAQRPYSHSQSVCTQAFWDPVGALGSKESISGYTSDDAIMSGLKNAVNSVESK